MAHPAAASASSLGSQRLRALIVIALGIFIDGYDLLVIGTALLYLIPAFHLKPYQTGLLGSVGVFGALIGMLVFGNLTDKLGRKTIFIFNLIFFVVASLAAAFVSNVWELFVARFVVGLGVGADVPTAMAFLAEASPKERRGATLGSLSQAMWVLGALASAAVALLIHRYTGPETWRWLFGLAAVPALLVLLARQTLPESPRWLVDQAKTEQAEQAAAKLGMATQEYEEIRSGPPATLNRHWWKRIALVAFVFWLNALAGATSTISSPYIFHYVGHATVTGSMVFTLILWTSNLAGIVVGFFIIDRIGKRQLALWSQVPSIVFILLMAFLYHDVPIFVTSFFLFGFFDWGGASPIQWAWGSELFPTRFRGLSQGMINGAARVAVIMTTFFVPVAIAHFGFTVTMAIFAVPLVFYCLIVWSNRFFDTTGLSLEEIERQSGLIPG